MLVLPDLVLALLEHGRQLAKVVLLARLVEPVPEDDGLEAEVDPGVVLRLDQPVRLLVEPRYALLMRQDRLGDLRRHRAGGRPARSGDGVNARAQSAEEILLKFDSSSKIRKSGTCIVFFHLCCAANG